MSNATLCPFSKPIIGRWCRCPFAKLSDRCAGKMVCIRAGECLPGCTHLLDVLKDRSRFILHSHNEDAQLTHAQLMKIRCGGLQGMQRVLELPDDKPPAVLEVIEAANARYGDVDRFPFNEIVQDIQAFSHRRKRGSDQ